jgi:disulfide bond formation protein DsbB
MYPLVPALAVAAVTRSRWARRYGLLAAGIGACISAWHYLVEWYPSLEPTNVCSLSNPCTTVWFRRMGFVSIPFMALCGFLAILGLLTMRSAPAEFDETDHELEDAPS